jgi:tetratricopeptide (TPR) repeat protein
VAEALYEKYKEALRRGHIAALRGRHASALAAYAEAAAIAPDRPLPHVSIGTTYLRLERAEDALEAFDGALARAAADEHALAGRADALVALRRRADAAQALDRLAEVLDRAGRLAEACDTARRALELAESRARRRHVGELVERLRDSATDAETAGALERALRVLEGRDGPPPEAAAGEDAQPAIEAAPRAAAADGSAVQAEPAPPDPIALVASAEEALEAGDAAAARTRFLEAVDAHRRLGHSTAALDAAGLALALGPLEPAIHLALVDLYLDRGWRSLARDKLVLLARLAEAGGDETELERLRAIAAERVPDAVIPAPPA